MPDLPTFTVSQATADRIIAAFEGHTDREGNPLTPQEAYLQWVRGRLVAFVTTFETLDDQAGLRQELGG